MKINKDEILNSYKWIEVKRFNPDDYDTFEEKYNALDKHHIEETNFLINKIREIVKDMEDLKGDNTFGCKTLPIIWGIRKTKWVLYLLLFLLATSVLLLNTRYTQLPLSYFLIFLFVPLGLLLARLLPADTRKDFYWLSQWCKTIMLLGIMSMVFI